MQKCCKCKKDFSYIEVLFAICFFWSKDIKCKNCNYKSKIDSSLKLLISILIALPIFFKDYLLGLGSTTGIIVFIAYELIINLLCPFFVKFSSTTENE